MFKPQPQPFLELPILPPELQLVAAIVTIINKYVNNRFFFIKSKSSKLNYFSKNLFLQLTNGGKINCGITKSMKILVAPLDWGLGHATRCIPIIQQLINAGHKVILGTNGPGARLLAQHFPRLEMLELPPYGLSYSSKKSGLKWIIFFQLPKMLTAIKREHRWLAMQMKNRRFDAVISDCRFGLHHPDAFCVFITHQLQIKSPFGKWTERFVQKRNYSFINKFNECWVPDFEGSNNLAGELSHPSVLPLVPVKYIGALSRFNKPICAGSAEKYDVLIIISGPEPQRTILENLMLKEFAAYKGKAALVRGLPGETKTLTAAGITVFNHLPAAELCAMMESSELIISRSGYTTVMDLVSQRKKSILIPTPGQTEQEYLGQYLMQKKLCICVQQHQFLLSTALQQAAAFDYADMSAFNMELSSSIFAS